MVVLRKVEGKILKRIISPLAPLLKAPAVETDKECTIMCTGEDITIQASARELTILLQISSSSFDVFWCSESGMTKVDLFLLNQIFISTGNQDSITIAVDYGGALIHFLFLHHRTYEYRYNLLRGNPITEYKDGVIFDDSKCEYDKVVVGIPSEQFRRILRHFEDSPFVCAVVTEAAVTFYSEPEDIVLKAEDGGCIIGDIMDDLGRVMILIFLVHPQSYIEASTLCDSVWIFHSSETRLSPNLVNFPVRGVGNLKFYLADWFAKSVI